jgi:hypothetical protein
MKKVIILLFIMFFSFGASTVFAARTDEKSTSDKLAVPDKTENKLSEEELSRLTKRVEEIRDMDKTNMSVKEKRELKKEVKEIKKNVQRNDGTVVIGVTTLLLIIILVVLLV